MFNSYNESISTTHPSPTDDLCRIGGEEFAIILPNTDLEGAFHVAENMRDSLASTPLDYEGETIKLTASAGVSTTIIIDEEHAQNLSSSPTNAFTKPRLRAAIQ